MESRPLYLQKKPADDLIDRLKKFEAGEDERNVKVSLELADEERERKRK